MNNDYYRFLIEFYLRLDRRYWRSAMIKVIKGKDGKMETVHVPDPDPKALESLHREVRDMIEGNKQFHDDPYAAPKPLPVEPQGELPFDPDLWMENYGGYTP